MLTKKLLFFAIFVMLLTLPAFAQTAAESQLRQLSIQYSNAAKANDRAKAKEIYAQMTVVRQQILEAVMKAHPEIAQRIQNQKALTTQRQQLEIQYRNAVKSGDQATIQSIRAQMKALLKQIQETLTPPSRNNTGIVK